MDNIMLDSLIGDKPNTVVVEDIAYEEIMDVFY